MIIIGQWKNIKPGDRITDNQGVITPENKVARRVTYLLADDLTVDEAKIHWQDIVERYPANPHDVKITLID